MGDRRLALSRQRTLFSRQLQKETQHHKRTRSQTLWCRAITIHNTETVPAAALFLFIGAVPHTAMVADIVERNHTVFILTGTDLIRNGRRPKGWTLKRDPFILEMSVSGIFAGADVRQGAARRVASAVGEGAITVGLVHQYLKTVW